EQHDDDGHCDRDSILVSLLTTPDPGVQVSLPARRRLLTAGLAGVTALMVLAVAVLFTWPIPRYVRFSPGPSPDVNSLINVKGAPSFPPQSRVGLALVIESPVDNLFSLAQSRL